MKYWELFDIPDESYALVIARIGRAHRKVDLLDTEVTPRIEVLGNGSEIHLPSLGALIRVAEVGRVHFKRHELIDSIVVEENEIIFNINSKYPELYPMLVECISEVWLKLKYYIKVTEATGFLVAKQQKISVKKNGEIAEIFEL